MSAFMVFRPGFAEGFTFLSMAVMMGAPEPFWANLKKMLPDRPEGEVSRFKVAIGLIPDPSNHPKKEDDAPAAVPILSQKRTTCSAGGRH